MTLNPFSNKSQQPNNQELLKTLGETFALWNQLIETISSRFAPVTIEWGFSSSKTGWGLRLKQNKRAILSMTPRQGFFVVLFALGEKAVKAAHSTNLPKVILFAIDNAPKYAEGRGVKLEIRKPQDIQGIEQLAIIKMQS